ncbi:hypothetical protein ACTFIZ_000907 [Dictyostelium cf. discoideum]
MEVFMFYLSFLIAILTALRNNKDQTPLSADKMNSQNSVLLIGKIGSFPNSIKNFRFFKGMIPEGVEKLELSDENENIPLSIPIKGIIPCGVEKMNIYDIGKDALLEESVPDSVKYTFLGFESDQAYSHFFPSLKK